MIFENRQEAGKRLAKELAQFRDEQPILVGRMQVRNRFVPPRGVTNLQTLLRNPLDLDLSGLKGT